MLLTFLTMGIDTKENLNIAAVTQIKAMEIGAIIREKDQSSDDTHLALFSGYKFYFNDKTYTSLRAGISEQVRGPKSNSKFFQLALGNDLTEVQVTHQNNQNTLGLVLKLPLN